MAGGAIKGKARKTIAEWALIRVEAEAGESWSELQRKFHISKTSLVGRARRDQWRIPKWGKMVEARKPAVSEAPVPSEADAYRGNLTPAYTGKQDLETPETPDSQLLSNLPKDLREALQSLASAPPESQQEAFGRVSGILIAQGILEIPPPRNVKELATWFSIFQKAHGLDKPKDSGAKDAGLFGSRGSGFRRTVGPVLPAVEVEMESESGDDYDPDCG